MRRAWASLSLILFLSIFLHTLPLSSENSGFFSRVNREVDQVLRRREGVLIWWDRQSGERLVFGNAAVAAQPFRPGSVFKLLVAEEAIRREGHPSFRCPGHARIAGERQFCWNRKGHGELDLARALGFSCNLFFARMGTLLGEAGWAAIAGRYPRLFPVSSMMVDLSEAELSRLAIGDHPAFKLSPEQMAGFWETYLTHLNEPGYAAIKEGLRRAVGEGTALRARDADLDLIGKTGTCDSETKSFKTDAWFVGAYPADRPRYAMVIFLKEAYGFREPAELARKVFQIAKDAR